MMGKGGRGKKGLKERDREGGREGERDEGKE